MVGELGRHVLGFGAGWRGGFGRMRAPDLRGKTSLPNEAEGKEKKPPFRPAPDDTKPVLRDPISRSDPVETEQAVLRLPPFP